MAASVISAAMVIQTLGSESKWINLLIMVPVLLLVGEITPKTLAIRNNVAFAKFQCQFIDFFARAISPAALDRAPHFRILHHVDRRHGALARQHHHRGHGAVAGG